MCLLQEGVGQQVGPRAEQMASWGRRVWATVSSGHPLRRDFRVKTQGMKKKKAGKK